MDSYSIVKFLHVGLAMIWVGGGLCLVILAVMADRARRRADFLAVLGAIGRIAPVVFVPASVAVLLSGVAMIWLGGLLWDAWLIVGLAGSAAAAAIGALGLGPLSARLLAMSGEPGREAEFRTKAQRLLQLAKFDCLIHFSTVFAMVVKPGWSDVTILTGMAILIGLGAALTQPSERWAESA